MTLTPIKCEARLMGFKKECRADGDWTQLTLHIHPDDTPHALFMLPLKTHLMLSITGTEEADPGAAQPADEQPAEPVQTPEEPARLKGGARARMAGILCGEDAFQQWLFQQHLGNNWSGWGEPMTAEGHAAGLVRWLCQIVTRAHLDHPEFEEAGRIWDQIEADYRQSQHGQSDPDMARMADAGPG